MLQVIKGEYENGVIILEKMPLVAPKTKALVILLDEAAGLDKESAPLRANNVLVFGSLRGQINVPDDFDEPLDDLQDYMY